MHFCLNVFFFCLYNKHVCALSGSSAPYEKEKYVIDLHLARLDLKCCTESVMSCWPAGRPHSRAWKKKKKRPSICQNINIPLPMPNRSPLSLPLSVTGNTSPHAARVSHDEASHPRTCDHVCIFTTLGIWQATWREDLPSKSIFTRTQGRNFGELIGVES